MTDTEALIRRIAQEKDTARRARRYASDPEYRARRNASNRAAYRRRLARGLRFVRCEDGKRRWVDGSGA